MGALLRKPSVMVLIAANALPLVGVLFFGWDLQAVLLLYWAESAVIGFYSILKMLVLGGRRALPTCGFFCLHYGIFMTVHLFFLLMLTNFNNPSGQWNTQTLLADVGLWFALAGLFASHGYSFVTNFLPDRKPDAMAWLPVPLASMDSRDACVAQQFMSPYGRIFVMHLTLLVSTLLIVFLFSPSALMLAVMIVFKTIADVHTHAVQHRFATQDATPAPHEAA